MKNTFLALALFAAMSTFLYLYSSEKEGGGRSEGGGGGRRIDEKSFEKMLNIQYCDTFLAKVVHTFFGWEGAQNKKDLNRDRQRERQAETNKRTYRLTETEKQTDRQTDVHTNSGESRWDTKL